MNKKKFYVTNAIPYVNAAPHIGHALEFVQSDVLVRYYKLKGYETLLLCGSDENALKNVQAAERAGQLVQEFVDHHAKIFEDLAAKLNVHFDVFQKGSNPDHFKSSQKLWELCQADIYQKEYKGLYCVGCELFYAPDELNENGECFEHPGKKLEEVAEKNYFFKLSKYQEQIIQLIKKDEIRITPESRKNEVLSFLKEPLHDISISRSNARARNWGVPVPGDDTQRMYVWFDALNIYQSGIGFGGNDENYKKWWPADAHVIGKGILRFHAVYWPAFLLSAKLELPKSILVHGYITVENQKMSKTLGNVIDPFQLIEKYGADPLRYYFIREVPTTGDGDFSENRMLEIYNSELANELGNAVSRITTLAEKDGIDIAVNEKRKYDDKIGNLIENFEFNLAVDELWTKVKELNKAINDFAPWEKNPVDRKDFLVDCLNKLNNIGYLLTPFIPDTAQKIISSTAGSIQKPAPLFPKR